MEAVALYAYLTLSSISDGEHAYETPGPLTSYRYTTIMSYTAGCTATRANYFANPDVSYLDRPTGTETENCARAIEENKVGPPMVRAEGVCDAGLNGFGSEGFCLCLYLGAHPSPPHVLLLALSSRLVPANLREKAAGGFCENATYWAQLPGRD